MHSATAKGIQSSDPVTDEAIASNAQTKSREPLPAKRDDWNIPLPTPRYADGSKRFAVNPLFNSSPERFLLPDRGKDSSTRRRAEGLADRPAAGQAVGAQGSWAAASPRFGSNGLGFLADASAFRGQTILGCSPSAGPCSRRSTCATRVRSSRLRASFSSRGAWRRFTRAFPSLRYPCIIARGARVRSSTAPAGRSLPP